MPWMYAVEDGKVNSRKGDSGGMSMAIWPDENGVVQTEHEAVPRIGVSMRVGSTYARSYSAQDWWQTTFITEIISDKEVDGKREVLFKTKNSTYLWKSD